MAKKSRTESPNRSQFIRELLQSNPELKHRQIREAWAQEGHKDPISTTLYYQVKKKLGLAGSRSRVGAGRGRGRFRISNASNGYLSIEQELDSLIAQSEQLGDSELVDDLKAARRRASARLLS